MMVHVLLFELRYRLRKVTTYVYLALFMLLGFIGVHRASVGSGFIFHLTHAGSGNINANAPYAVNYLISALSYVGTIIACQFSLASRSAKCCTDVCVGNKNGRAPGCTNRVANGLRWGGTVPGPWTIGVRRGSAPARSLFATPVRNPPFSKGQSCLEVGTGVRRIRNGLFPHCRVGTAPRSNIAGPAAGWLALGRTSESESVRRRS